MVKRPFKILECVLKFLPFFSLIFYGWISQLVKSWRCEAENKLRSFSLKKQSLRIAIYHIITMCAKSHVLRFQMATCIFPLTHIWMDVVTVFSVKIFNIPMYLPVYIIMFVITLFLLCIYITSLLSLTNLNIFSTTLLADTKYCKHSYKISLNLLYVSFSSLFYIDNIWLIMLCKRN